MKYLENDNQREHEMTRQKRSPMENVDNLTCTVLGVVILVKKRAVDANFSLSSFLFNMSYGG